MNGEHSSSRPHDNIISNIFFPSMGNTDKHKAKKCRRKIKIRLADPNIPDSYVCEILDSSLEDEEEYLRNDQTVLKEKPKNYFELLMPKKRKKDDVISAVSPNKGVKFSSNEEIIEKNKLNAKKNINTQAQQDVWEEECKADSSEDESLFQIQEKYKSRNFDLGDKKVAEGNNEVVCNKPLKTDISQKKTLSILSYFSKTQTGQKNKENCDLEEITAVRHSDKTCKNVNTLKPVKSHRNEKNIPVNGTIKDNVKLAPLFYKKEKKVINPAEQKARHDFLYKSTPSVVKKLENKVSENIWSFPAVSHVQQRNDSVSWSHREIHLPLLEVSPLEEHSSKNHKKFSLQVKHINIDNVVTDYAVEVNKDLLCKIKYKYIELNLERVIDGLKEKNKRFIARVEEMKKSKTQDTSDGFEDLNTLWTEKYKPKSCEILGNENVVRKMKKWLESWKSFDEELKALVKSSKNQKQEDDDSDDDFLNPDSENYGLKAPGNVCIISGPNGCGKTALVNALASELEFGVLELNASSKRTGKKVLSDLQEATQSHKVHRVNLTQPEILKNDKKKKKNRKRKKTKILEPKKMLDQSNDSKISLILIEDADIVFDEHDEGFFSAVSSLVQTSKRPIVFLTNEPNCHYLYNLKTEQCLLLEMEMPNFYVSCALLDIVSSLEGASFDREILEAVVRENNFDLRKSLLQLQFWTQSGKHPVVFQKKLDLGHLWWGLSKFLFNGDIKHFEKPKSRKRKRENDLFDSSDDEIEITSKKFKLDAAASKTSLPPCSDPIPNKSNPPIKSYFKILDLVSVLDGFSLSGSREPVPRWECEVKDSLSLEENMEESTTDWKNLGEQISNELVALSTQMFVGKEKENENRKLSFLPPSWEEIRWRNSLEKATEELSNLVSFQRGRDNRSLHLDYLPALRHICRIERNRSEMNPKRKNRFYHYLNNLGFEPTDENIEINCEVFQR